MPRRPRLDRDGKLLFAARTVRLFAYGALGLVLVLYLVKLGLDGATIGLILALTLVGDTILTLWLTTTADRLGRRRVLIIGSLLVVGAAVIFTATDLVPLLIVAATLGVLSPGGRDVGPFQAIEQASLTRLVPDRERTAVFAWYQLVGAVAVSFGALAAGLTVQGLLQAGVAELDAHRIIIYCYGLTGVVLALVFRGLSQTVEVPPEERSSGVGTLGLHRSRGTVFRLSALFALDSFASGFVLDSLMAFWFADRFGVEPAVIGAILFTTHLLAAMSALVSARIAARIGLINTMVFTHLPSNVLLILVPFMPTALLAVTCLVLRSTLSQMDIPARQSYTLAVVDPDERSAAAGVTATARSAGSAIAPIAAAPLLAMPGLAALPFVIAGSLKIVYDLTLWAMFRSRPAPEEQVAVPSPIDG
jgi:MFS family permease